jgi:molybdenum cofactor biosynthesis enzyme MoaA
MNYFEQEPEDNIFKTISIETTYRCQLACSNCYLGEMLNNDNIPDINIHEFESVIKKLPNRCDIRFIGAEPTLNKNLFNLIKITRSSGHRPSLLTNGIRLKQETYTKNLKNSGLNMLGLSMNGGLDDNIYELFDGGRYAKPKMMALENCFKYKILPHINVIVSPDNVHVLKPLLNYIIDTALKYNITFSPIKFPVALRLKSIGQMGNYMKTKSFSLTELAEVASELVDLKIDNILQNNIVEGFVECNSLMYKFETKAGIMLGKLTDWNVDDDGIPDAGSSRRGILTNNYKIAPFFEYYKKQQEILKQG